jgi:hypothetical protein
LEESAPVLKRRKLDDGQFAIPNDESNLSNMHLEEIPESPVEIIGAEDPTLSKLAPSNQPVNHAQLPKRKKTRRSRVQKRSRTYEDLIGMALHEAPDQHLEVSDIHQWVFENVPGYDSSDVSWKNGLSIVLTLNDDFVYHSHRSGNSFRDGTWTFRDGVDIKYRRWPGIMSQPSTADSHSRDTHADHSQDKQGAIPSVTAPVYKLEDGIPNPPKIQTTSNTVDSVAGANAISTPLASTIEETLETIDLTMDSEDEPLFVPEPRIPKRKITDDSSLDGSQRATSGNSHDQPPKQSLFARFSQPVRKANTHSPLRTKSATPFTDQILDNASGIAVNNLRDTEKWRAATEHINKLLNVPLTGAGSSDIPTKPSPTPPSRDHTRAASSNNEVRASSISEVMSHEPMWLDLHVEVPADTSAPPLEDNGSEIRAKSAELETTQAVETNDVIQQMDLDQPQGTPGRETSEDNMQSSVPVRHQSAQDLHEKAKSLPKSYVDTAVQTSPPAKSSFAIHKSVCLSLEPQFAVEVDTATAVQTDKTREQHQPQSPQLQATEALPNAAAKTTATIAVPSLSDENPKYDCYGDMDAELEADCLAVLDETMFPTTTTKTNTIDDDTDNDNENDMNQHASPPPAHPIINNDKIEKESIPLETILARPTRKQVFAKIGLSRLEDNNATTRTSRLKLGLQNVVEKSAATTATTRSSEIIIAQDGQGEAYFETLEELFDLPMRIVPFLCDSQLAFRDYAPVSFFSFFFLFSSFLFFSLFFFSSFSLLFLFFFLFFFLFLFLFFRERKKSFEDNGNTY